MFRAGAPARPRAVCGGAGAAFASGGAALRFLFLGHCGQHLGHDQRYAIDASKIERELGWRPQHNFEQGLRETVLWYINNRHWWSDIRSGAYRGERLGVLVS